MLLLHSEEKLGVGDSAPDFSLKGADGNVHSLAEIEAKAFLIVFMCNHCPYVKPKIDELKSLQEKYRDEGLVVIGINSNESVNYPEDSFEGMQEIAKEKAFNFLYLHDESQDVARAYGAVCTPDPFLFDSERKLVYHGRLDNALSPGQTPTEFYMDDAVSALFSGKEIKNPFLYSQGCSIKWKD